MNWFPCLSGSGLSSATRRKPCKNYLMSNYERFKEVFGQLVIVTPEEMDIKDKKRKEEREKKRMELGKKRFFKNETIKDYSQSPGNYGKERFVLYCESGNIYSTFIKQAEIDTIKERYEQGDMVQVTYTERPDKNDPDKVYLNLEGMSEVRREVSEEKEEQEEPKQAVLEPEKPVQPTLNEKEGSGKGEGRVTPIDPKERRISRLSLSNHAANLVAPNGDKFDSFDQMVEAYERLHIAMCEREGVE